MNTTLLQNNEWERNPSIGNKIKRSNKTKLKDKLTKQQEQKNLQFFHCFKL